MRKLLAIMVVLTCAGCDIRYTECDKADGHQHHFGKWQNEGHDYLQVRYCDNCGLANVIRVYTP